MPQTTFLSSRREALLTGLKLTAGGLASGLLAGCANEIAGLGSLTGPAEQGTVIGSGRVKVGLILPLSGADQAGAAATSLRNAAELALTEFPNADIQLLVKDDRGTAAGARAATQAAIGEGAELILGPLFAQAVQAAGQVAKTAGKPVIAFSTDASVASRGVYLLSFLPEGEVARIVAYSASRGRKSFAALIPESPYGNVVEAAFQQSVPEHGGRVVALERYSGDGGRLDEAVKRVAAAATQADAIFIPDAGAFATLSQSFKTAGISPAKLKPLGTSQWTDSRVLSAPAAQGGWFAGAPLAGFNAFAGRYRTRYGAAPIRIASLSYDAVSLAAALVHTQGSQRFSEAVLTNPSGFNGADGVFRFRPDGLNQRALAVYEVRQGNSVVVSAAPTSLTGA